MRESDIAGAAPRRDQTTVRRARGVLTALSARAKKRVLLAPVMAAGAIGVGVLFWAQQRPAMPAEFENAVFLRNIPANRWVKYHEERPGSWTRQQHAGIAYDQRRGSLLIFGSDTHGLNWDNSIHEFHPLRRRWETHYPQARPETYRADAAGRPISGDERVLPWAMHTYDTIEYHPRLEALLVTARPSSGHETILKTVPGVRDHPTWIYDLAQRRWKQFENNGKPAPDFFAGSSAFDDARNVLVAYRKGIWELDLDAGEWRLATPESHHEIHHTMAYDARRGLFFVFGDYRRTNRIWAYRPGLSVGRPGVWTEFVPEGDSCPRLSTAPAAYDMNNGVFLLVANRFEKGPDGRQRAVAASTYTFDPDTKRCSRLPEAEFDPIGMNYMMVWDRINHVFFLVTDSQGGVVSVWTLRLQR